jgi:hypothetical protein
MIAVSRTSSGPKIRPSNQPKSAISRALPKMRCQSGLMAPALLFLVVITSAGAYTAAPTTAPTPAPTPSIAAPSTAPDAAPRATPQTAASRSWPEGLRLRRSRSAISGVSPHGDGRLRTS